MDAMSTGCTSGSNGDYKSGLVSSHAPLLAEFKPINASEEPTQSLLHLSLRVRESKRLMQPARIFSRRPLKLVACLMVLVHILSLPARESLGIRLVVVIHMTVGVSVLLLFYGMIIWVRIDRLYL